MSADDTIVALSSGRPPAAIAVVRMSGPQALTVAKSVSGSIPPAHQARVRRIRSPVDDRTIDHALVVHFAAPHSATGENVVEFQCHGGRAVVNALIDLLSGFDGVRLALPGEFTRRALENGKLDLTQAEGLADLLEAETEVQRQGALKRSEGALRKTIDEWRDALLAASARVEVAIDYADEDDGATSPNLADLSLVTVGIDALLRSPRVEKLRDGIRVVVAGPPNAGKSSLVNALAGQERAIVTPIPGTTRDRIEVPLAIAGLPFVLVDTAGLRESGDEVEQIGITLARREVQEGDIILWMGQSEEAPSGAILLHARADVRPVEEGAGMPVSARTGVGLDELKRLLHRRGQGLVPSPKQLAVTTREAEFLQAASTSILRAQSLSDPVTVAEELRIARVAFDSITGQTGVEDLLDALFGRFCLGK